MATHFFGGAFFGGEFFSTPAAATQTQADSIIAFVVATLATAAVAAGGVFRSRVEAFGRSELPAVVVRPGAEKRDAIGRNVVKRTLAIEIEVLTRADADATADQASAIVLAAIHSALTSDRTLGGRCARLVEGEMQEPELADGDDTAGALKQRYEAIYATRADDNTRQFHVLN